MSRTSLAAILLAALLLALPLEAFLALAGTLLLGLAVWTNRTRARIEARYPPIGRFVEANGTRIHYVERGDPRAVPTIVLHGASGNLRDQMSAPYAAHLERAVFVDRPGHGHSSRGGDANATPDGQAATVVAMMDVLGIDRAVVLGHSYAGAVAASMALHHRDRVRGLVLVSPVTHPWPGGRMLWYYELGALPLIGPLFAHTLLVPFGLRRMACAVGGVFAPQPVVPDYHERAGTLLALRPRNFLANAHDLTRLFPAILRLATRWRELSVPTVVIAGTRDRIVGTDIHARPFARAVPHARLVTVEGLGHKPDYWTPDLLAGAVQAVRADRVHAFDPAPPRVPVLPDPPETGEDARGIETGPDVPEPAR